MSLASKLSLLPFLSHVDTGLESYLLCCKPVPLLNNYGTILHYQQCGGPTLVVEHDQNVR
jgi:hypothetical protein